MSRQAHLSDPGYSPDVRFSLRAILIAFVLAAPILWLFAVVRNHSIRHEARVAARTKAIWATLTETANAAEQIRTSQGRAPIDRAEIEAILGHSMSVEIGSNSPSEIYYQRPSPSSYQLVFPTGWLEGFGGDYLLFDSANPIAGWVEVCD